MKVIKTILRAFLFGIGVGILLAPRAGSETRQMLSERLNKLMDGASDLADNFGGSNNATNTSYVPSQHYTESNTTREVGTTDRMSM